MVIGFNCCIDKIFYLKVYVFYFCYGVGGFYFCFVFFIIVFLIVVLK